MFPAVLLLGAVAIISLMASAGKKTAAPAPARPPAKKPPPKITAPAVVVRRATPLSALRAVAKGTKGNLIYERTTTFTAANNELQFSRGPVEGHPAAVVRIATLQDSKDILIAPKVIVRVANEGAMIDKINKQWTKRFKAADAAKASAHARGVAQSLALELYRHVDPRTKKGGNDVLIESFVKPAPRAALRDVLVATVQAVPGKYRVMAYDARTKSLVTRTGDFATSAVAMESMGKIAAQMNLRIVGTTSAASPVA
jgi:hypothetical protein